jgi:hypothetical protein
VCHMSCSPHPPWFNHPNNICEEYRLWSSSLCNFLHNPSSSLLRPNIFLNIVLKNPQSMFLKVRVQVSHLYGTTGKITVLYNLIFSFFDTVISTFAKYFFAIFSFILLSRYEHIYL